jgi:hypothetical protein
VALFSGVLLYTVITVGMSVAAVLTCRKAEQEKDDTTETSA